ncbi:MAG: 3-oxoacyl-ACP reductase [Myxococcales bacterium]|nr:3-oxoacyl-ACP reductase [Myxococcales bacterium]
MRDYEGKVVVITGASAGIGAATAKEMAGRGARVVLAARREEELRALATTIGAGALAIVTDVTRRDEVQRLAEQAIATCGHVDIWINNAGRGITRSILELSDEDVDAMMRDNLKSVLYGIQAIVPHLVARGDGAVVNVSSMLSRLPLAPFRSAYAAAKAAVNSLTDMLRVELRDKAPGVRVVCVLPGVVKTDFGEKAIGGGPNSRTLPGAQEVDEVARVIADGVLAKSGDVYTRPEFFDRSVAHLGELAR